MRKENPADIAIFEENAKRPFGMRDKIGYVPQKGVLFSGDIASNILFGNPDGGEAVMKEIVHVWLNTEFSHAERHQRRIDKVMALEK